MKPWVFATVISSLLKAVIALRTIMECVNFQTYTLLKATVCVHNSLHFAQSGISKIMKQDQIIGEGV